MILIIAMIATSINRKIINKQEKVTVLEPFQ